MYFIRKAIFFNPIFSMLKLLYFFPLGIRSLIIKSSTKATQKNIFVIIFKEKRKHLNITRLPVTRWVKLSLNFELLVPKLGNEIFIRSTPF